MTSPWPWGGILAGFAWLVVLALGAAAGERSPSGWRTGTNHMVVDGRDRTFLLDLPPGRKPGAALVLVFHGFTGSAANIRRYAGFSTLAERHGFVVVYPQGTLDSKGQAFFNVGYDFHRGEQVDDVAFVRSLVGRLVRDLDLDERSVFSTGFSNGGDMTFFLGSQKQPFVAAIAPVAGTMMASWAAGFRPASRIPVLAVNVSDDRTTLWAGDMQNRDGWGAYLGTEAVVDLWVRGLALERSDPARVRGEVRVHRWSTAADNAEVRLYGIAKGGHHWPRHLGDRGVPTAEALWHFFDSHRPRGPR